MILYTLQIDKKIDLSFLKKYSCYISKERQQKIEKYLTDNSKIISTLTELLLRYCIILELGIENNKIIFSYGENGKPALLINKNFRFSVSHSGNIICVLTHDKPVGLDLEYYHNINSDVAKKFFTKKEYEIILKNKNPIKMFFRIWTRKEAYIKLFDLKFLELLKPSKKNDKDVFYKNLDFKSYAISIASQNQIPTLKFKYISLEEVLKIYD